MRLHALLRGSALSILLVAVGCGGGGGGGNTNGSGVAPVTSQPGQQQQQQPGPSPSPSPVPSPSPSPTPAGAAHLSVDTNRDGQITAADEAGRATWSSSGGAVFVFNNDDDDKKGKPDSTDNIINGANDPRDLGQVIARKIAATPVPATATLSVSPATAPVRVFVQDPTAQTWSELIAPSAGTGQLSVANLQAGDVNLLVEGTAHRSATFDGNITLTLTLADASGTALSTDVVALREAPIIYTDNTRAALAVYAMNITDPNGGPNQPFWTALSSGLQSQNVPLLDCDQNTYGFDRWVQDNMQIGYQGYPSPNGPTWANDLNQLERGSGAGGGQPQADLWLLAGNLLAPNYGYTYAGVSQSQDSPNYGGNFEVLPNYGDPNFPFGRCMHGGGNAGTIDGSPTSRHMNPEEVALIEAQGMQSPTIEISSEWLAVGHLDEFLMAVKDQTGTSAHGWKLLWSSPALAISALKQLSQAGKGSTVVFSGETEQTTVDTLLNDAANMTYNDQAQARLDSDKATLMQLTGLTAADFCDVPVMYEIAAYQGLNFAVAKNPGVQNCIPVNDTIYVPDPEGPKDATGKDVWQQQVLTAVQPLGVKVVFVNVFQSYHELMGEAHCGSNVLYQPYDAPWWTK